MPPDNAGYMYAAYIIGGAIVLVYAIYLFLKTRKYR